MPRLARLLPVLLLAPLLGAVVPPAHADPVPGIAEYWPRCGSAPDDDGRYCIVSVTKDGVPVPQPTFETFGVYDEPYVDLIGGGDVRFGLYETTYDSSGFDSDADVDPSHTWTYTVNTGAIRPREVYGHIRDVDYSTGGNATDGWTFTLTFRPTPIAWMWPPDADGDGWADCSYDGGCGDDTTVAGLVYDGFVTGYVTDLASSGLGSAEIADRTGFVNTYNAQDAYAFYDPDTNALEVRMANPHLRSPGVAAVGYYETFFPDAMLINEFGVPDPTTLTSASFAISRVGSGPAPATVTREATGVRVTVDGITFSTPRYRIKPKASAPGAPRIRSADRVSPHQVEVRFRRPVADGGADVTKYTARCHRPGGEWHKASGTGSPIVVGDLSRRVVACQVRAVNRVGAGPWSAEETA